MPFSRLKCRRFYKLIYTKANLVLLGTPCQDVAKAHAVSKGADTGADLATLIQTYRSNKMPRFDGMGPRGQGIGGFGRGSNCQGQGRGQRRGVGQRQCLFSEGVFGIGNRVGATQNRRFLGSNIDRLQSTIEAMQARLAKLMSQGKS